MHTNVVVVLEYTIEFTQHAPTTCAQDVCTKRRAEQTLEASICTHI